jgi:hypothetical protein
LQELEALETVETVSKELVYLDGVVTVRENIEQ